MTAVKQTKSFRVVKAVETPFFARLELFVWKSLRLRESQFYSKKCCSNGEPLATLCSIWPAENWTTGLQFQWRTRYCSTNWPVCIDHTLEIDLINLEYSSVRFLRHKNGVRGYEKFVRHIHFWLAIMVKLLCDRNPYKITFSKNNKKKSWNVTLLSEVSAQTNEKL